MKGMRHEEQHDAKKSKKFPQQFLQQFLQQRRQHFWPMIFIFFFVFCLTFLRDFCRPSSHHVGPKDGHKVGDMTFVSGVNTMKEANPRGENVKGGPPSHGYTAET
jgi:hypothetical protein